MTNFAKRKTASSPETFTGKTKSCKHTEQADEYYFSNRNAILRIESSPRQLNVMVCLYLRFNLYAANLGFSISFGVMLPALMEEFDESKQKTGESHFESGVTLWL